MAIFEEGSLRSASVYAQGECTLLVLHKDEFFDAMARTPALGQEMLKILARRVREANSKLVKNRENG